MVTVQMWLTCCIGVVSGSAAEQQDMARSRLHKRYVKNPCSGVKSNPPLFTELLEFAGPGFAAFAVTRLGTRIAATQIAKWKPEFGKHAGALTSAGAFLVAWFLGHRWKAISKYHTPITVGAAIAALQSVIQLYIPKLGWMVADASPELASTAAGALAEPQPQSIARGELYPVQDDPNEYTYNEAYDAGRYSKTGHVPKQQPAGQSPPIIAQDDADPADLSLSDMIGSDNLGVFTQSN